MSRTAPARPCLSKAGLPVEGCSFIGGADWVEGELLRIQGDHAIVLSAKAGSRNPVDYAVYDPRNVRTTKPKKGESYP